MGKVSLYNNSFLIIDDARSLGTAGQVKGFLTSVGARNFRVAKDSDEALSMLQAEIPDALVCPMDMAPLDGAAFLRHLRAKPDLAAFAALPALLIVGADDNGTWKIFKDEEALSIVGKPVTLDRICNSLNDLLNTDGEKDLSGSLHLPETTEEEQPHNVVEFLVGKARKREAARQMEAANDTGAPERLELAPTAAGEKVAVLTLDKERAVPPYTPPSQSRIDGEVPANQTAPAAPVEEGFTPLNQPVSDAEAANMKAVSQKSLLAALLKQ